MTAIHIRITQAHLVSYCCTVHSKPPNNQDSLDGGMVWYGVEIRPHQGGGVCLLRALRFIAAAAVAWYTGSAGSFPVAGGNANALVALVSRSSNSF